MVLRLHASPYSPLLADGNNYHLDTRVGQRSALRPGEEGKQLHFSLINCCLEAGANTLAVCVICVRRRCCCFPLSCNMQSVPHDTSQGYSSSRHRLTSIEKTTDCCVVAKGEGAKNSAEALNSLFLSLEMYGDAWQQARGSPAPSSPPKLVSLAGTLVGPIKVTPHHGIFSISARADFFVAEPTSLARLHFPITTQPTPSDALLPITEPFPTPPTPPKHSERISSVERRRARWRRW